MSTTRRGQSTSKAGRADLYQIGDVAERVGLSLRTVRYYEEAGLLRPAGRTAGGFRLYDEDTVDRLFMVKKMKPLGFSLEEMRSLLTLRDELARPGMAPDARAALEERLRTWVTLAEEKLATLREQLGVAEIFVEGLHDDADRSRRV
ncbi:MerR family transcriptional regulator [Frankia nepalensis]|uniref:MerR family transcriptional regulator n=1 Tax=Frankia nepalensis TaxID=1836974 RepID=UPI001EE3DA22|nr:MerR family transcriptional regulator [Frankia nepalensis]